MKTFSRAMQAVVIVGALALGGALLGPVAAPAWHATRARQPALRLEAAGEAAGQGVTLALLGGFRGLVADMMWLRVQTLWERRDLAGTEALARLVPALDPRPLFFWLNGARMIAHDAAAWRIEAAGGFGAVSAEQQRRIDAEQGRRALAHLALAQRYHPQSVELWVERANIELTRLRDFDAAAESYRRAWEAPRGPYYAARLHAEMLRRAGRPAEALAWLVRLHPQLPAADDAAAADLVLSRIRELERQLGVPRERAYRPAPR